MKNLLGPLFSSIVRTRAYLDQRELDSGNASHYFCGVTNSELIMKEYSTPETEIVFIAQEKNLLDSGGTGGDRPPGVDPDPLD